MKKIILAIFLLVSAFSYALREVNGVLYRNYVNERFGFDLEYPPEILFMQPPPTNGDGRIFLSEEQDAEMRIYGTYFLAPSTDFSASDSNAKQLVRSDYHYNLAKDYLGAKIAYQKLNEEKGWYVISGTMNEDIFYHKVNLVPGSDPYFLVFQMKYPSSEKETYNKILEDISKSIQY